MHGQVAVLVDDYEVSVEPVEDPPTVEPSAVLTRVERTNVCGSELHMWRREMPVPNGIVLGHEAVLRVEELGEAVETDSAGEPLKEGDLVTPVYFQPCGSCVACGDGQFYACDITRSTRDWMKPHTLDPYYHGTFATHYYLDEGQYFYKVPDGVSAASAAGANCALSQVLFGLESAGVRRGDSVVIQGAGGLGLAAVAVAGAAGAETIVIEGTQRRLDRAAAFGADHLVDLREYEAPDDRARRVRELTDGAGADIGVEVAGFPEVFSEGPGLLRHGATYLEIGNISPGLMTEFDPASLTLKRITVMAQLLYQPWYLRRALSFLADHGELYPFDRLVDAEYPLTEAQTALEDSDNQDVTRACLLPGDD